MYHEYHLRLYRCPAYVLPPVLEPPAPVNFPLTLPEPQPGKPITLDCQVSLVPRPFPRPFPRLFRPPHPPLDPVHIEQLPTVRTQIFRAGRDL